MKKNLAIAAATLASLTLPVLAFAQVGSIAQCANGGAPGISSIICTIYRIIQIVIPVLILGAVAYFIWGIVQFITAHDAEEKGEARSSMVHGIIGFAVILGLWGLVNVLLSTFSLNNGATPVNSFPVF